MAFSSGYLVVYTYTIPGAYRKNRGLIFYDPGRCIPEAVNGCIKLHTQDANE
jgi:hypothetical protein